LLCCDFPDSILPENLLDLASANLLSVLGKRRQLQEVPNGMNRPELEHLWIISMKLLAELVAVDAELSLEVS